MKKIISLILCVLLLTCSFAQTVFAEDIFFNTLNDQATLTNIKDFETYTVGYTIGCNCSNDWNLQLIERAEEDGSIGYSYAATVTAGSTVSAQINCFDSEDMSLAIIAIATDENGEEVARVEKGKTDNREMAEAELTVPENAKKVGFFLFAIPRSISLEYSVGYSVTLEMTVDGKEEFPIAPVGSAGTQDTEGETDDQSDLDWIMEDKSDEVNSIEDALTEIAKGAVKTAIILGVVGVGAIVGIIAIFKGIAAKKAAAAGAKAAGKAIKKVAESARPKDISGAENAGAGNSGVENIDDSYVVTDPATGAQTLYVKDAEGNWVSSDGNSVLDTDKLPDWQKQRGSDRAWQNKANEELKKPTKFEDIDRKQVLEEEQIHRESYYEKIAIEHGADPSDMDAVYEKVAHDQARAEVDAHDWNKIAEHNDTGLKIAENLKTTADYSVSALGSVTGPMGTVVKDIYAAGTTIGGDVSEAVAAGKDAFDVAQVAAGAITKSAVSVIQNHATGVVGKAAADIAGGATSGGIDAYVKGESVGQGIAKGTASGAINSVVDAGGEMVGALKDGSTLGADAKDFVSSVSDTVGDFVKNKSSDAVGESFDKTFKELKPKK